MQTRLVENRRRHTVIAVLAALSILAGGAVLEPSSAVPGGGTGNCAPAGSTVTKVENPGDEYTFTAPEGDTVSAVYLKAGRDCITFTGDFADDCYTVSGIGTNEVTVERTGSGRECKEISHLEFVTTTEPTTTTTEPPTTTTTDKPTTTTTLKKQ